MIYEMVDEFCGWPDEYTGHGHAFCGSDLVACIEIFGTVAETITLEDVVSTGDIDVIYGELDDIDYELLKKALYGYLAPNTLIRDIFDLPDSVFDDSLDECIVYIAHIHVYEED